MDTSHQFQEYTYKKITPCDICSQVLRGHTRQGLKCRLCKTNVHVDCQEKVPAKCQPKSRLLRRQKSTSEIETRVTPAAPDEEGGSSDISQQCMLSPFGGKKAETPPSEVDSIYQVLKTANEISSSRTSAGSMAPPLAVRRNQQGSTAANKGPSTLSVANQPIAISSAPSSPVHNRRLLSARNMRMSSVELPDDNEKSLSSASTSPCPSPVRMVTKHKMS
ncbi:SH3 and cysteine-rich domain-containing protein 2-like [Diaphorina citri]|uniref:SH3 and cysteine-rich domain-containing protein 2-like n=1 Tax=Diaphorina citri TaxID=121845 RepID=A0A3Q0JI96_DIACI|nr:SH3 and cysteine-rich domain-containing protein 2-like [Diaphorina citri]